MRTRRHIVLSVLLIALISAATTLAGALSGTNISNSDGDSISPVLAPDGSDTVHAVWEEDETLYTNRKPDGGSWLSTPVQISTGSEPALDRGSDGTLHLVWSDYSVLKGNYEIYYSKWLGSGWDVPLNVSSTTANSSSPDVAARPDGSAYVVWFDPSVIYFGIIASTGVVSSTGLVTIGSGVQNPAVDVSADGVVHLAWQKPDDDTGKYEILYSRNAGSGWGLAEEVSRSPGIDSLAPDVAVTSDGIAYVIWTQGSSVVYAARKATGWTAPITVSQGTAYSPFIAADDAGFVHAVWTEQDTSGYRLVYGWGKDGTLGRAQTLVSSSLPIGEGALYPVASGSTFTLHVVWSARTSATGPHDIYYGVYQWDLNAVYLPVILR